MNDPLGEEVVAFGIDIVVLCVEEMIAYQCDFAILQGFDWPLVNMQKHGEEI